MENQEILIGVHASAQGGVHNALIEGASVGASTIQLFTANQKRWKGKPLTPEVIELWKHHKQETGLKEIMSHDSYLINLGAPKPENLEKSRIAFREEIERCHQLEISYLNFHPGAAVGDTREACIERIIESLLEIEELVSKGNTLLVLEATAGQGTCVGWQFEDLGDIIQGVKGKIPLGVCIDTCHIFAAGYDIRTKEAWDATLKEFDQKNKSLH